MTSNGKTHRTIAFGPFELDLTERLLTRDGKPVQIAPKLFDTLALLVENAGHVVEKNEMMERLWQNTFVEESSLSQNIFQLRKALENGASGTQYIETIPKRGYRFVAGVIQVTDEVTNGDDRSFSPFMPSGSSLNNGEEGRLAIKSLAILPFKPLAEEKTDEYLGLGLAHATIIKLSGLRHLVVLPTRSVFKCAGRKTDPLAVGRSLGVDAVLDGTIQREHERVRVTVELISLADSKTVWSAKFDEYFPDIFTVEDSISEQVVNALALRITADEQRHLRNAIQKTQTPTKRI